MVDLSGNIPFKTSNITNEDMLTKFDKIWRVNVSLLLATI